MTDSVPTDTGNTARGVDTGQLDLKLTEGCAAPNGRITAEQPDATEIEEPGADDTDRPGGEFFSSVDRVEVGVDAGAWRSDTTGEPPAQTPFDEEIDLDFDLETTAADTLPDEGPESPAPSGHTVEEDRISNASRSHLPGNHENGDTAWEPGLEPDATASWGSDTHAAPPSAETDRNDFEFDAERAVEHAADSDHEFDFEIAFDFEDGEEEQPVGNADVAEEITLAAEPWSPEPSPELEPPAGEFDPDSEQIADAGFRAAHEPLHENSYEQALESLPPTHDDRAFLFADWGQASAGAYSEPEDADMGDAAEHIEPTETLAGEEIPFAEPASSQTANDAPEIPGDTVPAAAPRFENGLVEELEATLAQPKRRLPTLLFGVGSLLLLGLLLGQAGSAFRAELARSPVLAPVAALFCEGPECAPQPQQAPDRIRIVNRDVRPHPQEAGALLISLSFVNEAEFAQPYPVLEIGFSDIHDQLIALRRFLPAEYLGAEHRSSDPLPPDELIAISLSIVDPGERGVSFRFEFY